MKDQGLLLAVMVVLVAMMGCGSVKTGHSHDLVVVEHTDTIRGTQEWNNYEWAAFTVDVPVDGPSMLVDSVKAFINSWLSRSQDKAGKRDAVPENPFLAYALGEKEIGGSIL